MRGKAAVIQRTTKLPPQIIRQITSKIRQGEIMSTQTTAPAGRSLTINSTPALDMTGSLNVTYTQQADQARHYVQVIGVALEGTADNSVQRLIPIMISGPNSGGTTTVNLQVNQINDLKDIDAVFAIATRENAPIQTWQDLQAKIQARDARHTPVTRLGTNYAFATRAIHQANLDRAKQAGQAIVTAMTTTSFKTDNDRRTMVRNKLREHNLPVDDASDAQIDLIDAGISKVVADSRAPQSQASQTFQLRSGDSVTCDFCQAGLWIVVVFIGFFVILAAIGLTILLGAGGLALLTGIVATLASAAGVALRAEAIAVRILDAAHDVGDLTHLIQIVIINICKQTGDCPQSQSA
jgi:hypothetical protein